MHRTGNITVLNMGDREYPARLLDLPDPPKKLFCIGDTGLLGERSIAVVGSRKASEYGRQTAMNLGRRIAENGLVHVSGMARGIDCFSHMGALKAGGGTVAVLGQGVDVIYPRENAGVYAEIMDRGLILSEQEPGTRPKPYMFPLRNRIIAALSETVTVVEAGTESGSLITASLAEDLGRRVFAVPGNITSHGSLGTNKLIADGAEIVTVIDDIFSGMNIKIAAGESELALLGEDEKKLYLLIKEQGEVSMEFICRIMNRSAVDVTALVSVLEIKGLAAYSLGKVFAVR